MTMELALWLLFCAPGLIYSIWRLTTKKYVCASCKNSGIIPLASPNGQRLHAQNNQLIHAEAPVRVVDLPNVNISS